jgi:hypothetical protein
VKITQSAVLTWRKTNSTPATKKELGNAAKHRANWTEDQRESQNKNNTKMPQDTKEERNRHHDKLGKVPVLVHLVP